MCIIPELYRVDMSYFCLIFSVAVALILLSCTFSESANLPDFIVETELFGRIKVNAVTLLLRISRFLQECNQGWCCVLWPWLLGELFLGLERNVPPTCSCILCPWGTQDVLIHLAGYRIFNMVLVWKNPSLLLCWILQYSTLLTAGMVLLCRDKCGLHSWYICYIEKRMIFYWFSTMHSPPDLKYCY
jgi:hypothetical protein